MYRWFSERSLETQKQILCLKIEARGSIAFLIEWMNQERPGVNSHHDKDASKS